MRAVGMTNGLYVGGLRRSGMHQSGRRRVASTESPANAPSSAIIVAREMFRVLPATGEPIRDAGFGLRPCDVTLAYHLRRQEASWWDRAIEDSGWAKESHRGRCRRAASTASCSWSGCRRRQNFRPTEVVSRQ